MSARLRKQPFTFRLGREQRTDLKEAARLETARRREIVDEGTLAREILMRGVHELLVQAGRQPASAAA